MWRVVRLVSLGFVLCCIFLFALLTLQSVPIGKGAVSAMDFPNRILEGSRSQALQFGSSIKNLLPVLGEDSSVTEVKDTVIKPDSTLLPKPKKVFGTKKAQVS